MANRMKITKSQKVCGSVLGLCVCALMIDQCFGSKETPKPQIAPAKPISVKDAIKRKSNDASASTTDLAQCLRALQAAQLSSFAARDAFDPPAAFVGDDVRKAPPERALNFQSGHHLKAIIDSPGHSQAIVDDRLIDVGQWVDGFELESVGRMRAIFSDGEIHVQLKLPDGD